MSKLILCYLFKEMLNNYALYFVLDVAIQIHPSANTAEQQYYVLD